MKVFQVLFCEEYAFQVDHGLWSTKERAIEAAKKLIIKDSEWNQKGQPEVVSIIEVMEGQTYILAGQWTKESFNAWLDKQSNYWWYAPPFDHHGVGGVFEVEVNE